MTTTTPPDLSQTIADLKANTDSAHRYLLVLLDHVPDDKLSWSPSASARTPLHLVAHCGMANRAFATVIRGEELPDFGPPEEAVASIRAAGRDVATREEAKRLIEETTAEVLRALDTVTPERIATSPDSPFGPMPFTVWMNLPVEHTRGHSSQLAYLQTVWGDLDDHM